VKWRWLVSARCHLLTNQMEARQQENLHGLRSGLRTEQDCDF